MTNRTRQPKFGTTARLMPAASASPSGNAAIMEPVERPRMRPGMNSAVKVSVTGTSPPSPKFDTKRNTASEATFHAAATSPVNKAKIATVAWKAVRRPI